MERELKEEKLVGKSVLRRDGGKRRNLIRRYFIQMTKPFRLCSKSHLNGSFYDSFMELNRNLNYMMYICVRITCFDEIRKLSDNTKGAVAYFLNSIRLNFDP